MAHHALDLGAAARRSLYAGRWARTTGKRPRLRRAQLQIAKGAYLVAWINRQETPIELSSLSIGPVTIVHLPGEPFIMYQLLAQKLGGERFVAVAGYGDGGCGYLCTEAAYAEGGYEPTASFVGPRSQYALEDGRIGNGVLPAPRKSWRLRDG